MATAVRAAHAPLPPSKGHEIEGNDAEGALYIQCATPGIARGINGNPERQNNFICGHACSSMSTLQCHWR